MSAPAVDLRAERVNRGLSIAAAAKQMGVQADALARAERGQGTPHPRNGFRIAKFYGYKVTDIWPVQTASPPATATEAAA